MLEKLFKDLHEVRKLIEALKEKEAAIKESIIRELEEQGVEKFEAEYGRAVKVTKINAKVKQDKIKEALEKYPLTMFELRVKNATKFASIVEEDDIFEAKTTTYWQIK